MRGNQLSWRRDLLGGIIKDLPRHIRPYVGRGSPRRDRQLHTPVPHVLRVHCILRPGPARHWRHQRASAEPVLLGVPGQRVLAQ